jgi:uncharacterized membrane protein YheB (UPF0754 family)
MRKLSLILLIGITAVSSAADADTVQENSQKIQADIDAVHKDNEALQRDVDQLEKDRSIKASAKNGDDYSKQATSSLAIGADKAAISEKKVEKSVDQNILKHHQNEMNDKINAEMQNSDTVPTPNGTAQ